MGLGSYARNGFPKVLGELETIRFFRANHDVRITRHSPKCTENRHQGL